MASDSSSDDPAPGQNKATERGSRIVQNARPRVELSWLHINYTVKVKKQERTILNDISGLIKPGSFVAILGPSGSGKTTLLNALSGRLKSGVTGSIKVNRKEINRKSFKRIAGFVTQEDVMLPFNTVREILQFSANMRLPRTMTAEAKQQRVKDVLQDLGLEKVEHSIIGDTVTRGVSGGEKKRVSIGRELVTDPAILFLDEPTSGLDASTAYLLVQSLASLAHHGGRTVITTIHQPRASIMELFDQVILLAEGEVAYAGPYEQSVPYFSALGHVCPNYANPADFFLDVLAKDTRTEESKATSLANIRAVLDHYNQKEKPEIVETVDTVSRVDNGEFNSEHSKEMRLGLFMQVYYLFGRNIKNQARNVKVIVAKLVVSVIMALFTGLLYLQLDNDQKSVGDRNGFLFFAVLQHGFPELNMALMTWPAEKPVFLHERSTGTYRVIPYIIAKAAAELPQQMFGPIIFSSISYWMIGLQPGVQEFFTFMAALFVSGHLSCSMGYMVGSLVTIGMMAPICTALMVIFMVFGGFFVNSDSIPVYFLPLYYASMVKYVFEIGVCPLPGDLACCPRPLVSCRCLQACAASHTHPASVCQ